MGRFVFKLPDLGEGTAEAELVGWHVKVGDRVEEDQIVADVVIDIATVEITVTVEITAPVSGTVSKLHGEPGEMLAVRGPLVEFEVEGSAATEPEAAAESPSTASRSQAELNKIKGKKKVAIFAVIFFTIVSLISIFAVREFFALRESGSTGGAIGQYRSTSRSDVSENYQDCEDRYAPNLQACIQMSDNTAWWESCRRSYLRELAACTR